MATLIGKEANFRDTLAALVELEFDAVAAYEVAVGRIDDPMTRDRLAEFTSDHQRHIQELSAALRGLGRVPPTSGDAKAVLTQGKVAIGSLMGDQGILSAMHSNEDDTNEAYERALRREDLPPPAWSLLQSTLADERRHRAWIASHLASS